MIADATNILLAAGRFSGLAFTAPLLSHAGVGRFVRVLAAIALAIGLAGEGGSSARLYEPFGLAIATAVEFAIGAAVGLAARLAFVGIDLAAEQISVQMGISLGQVYSNDQQDSSPLVTLFGLIAALVFIFIGGVDDLVWAVGESLRLLPVGATVGPSSLIPSLIAGLSGAFVLALKIAAGALAAMLIASAGLGILQRMLPQAHILTTGLPVRSALGLLAAAGGLKALGWALEAYWPAVRPMLPAVWKGA
jgi:flagellar biosynthetic protein FliR